MQERQIFCERAYLTCTKASKIRRISWDFSVKNQPSDVTEPIKKEVKGYEKI